MNIFIQIEVLQKNKRSHIGDIASIIFMEITKSWVKMHSRTNS